MVPFGYSAFLSESEVGHYHEFAEITVADSKNISPRNDSRWAICGLGTPFAV
jgi:hypothetical protein